MKTLRTEIEEILDVNFAQNEDSIDTRPIINDILALIKKRDEEILEHNRLMNKLAYDEHLRGILNDLTDDMEKFMQSNLDINDSK